MANDCVSYNLGALKAPHQIIKCNKCVLDSRRCYYLRSPCMTAGIGDMGPEAVYCFHMEPTCVLHLPGDLIFFVFTVICTLRVLLALRHHHAALLSFVSKSENESLSYISCAFLHFSSFLGCFNMNGLHGVDTHKVKSKL